MCVQFISAAGTAATVLAYECTSTGCIYIVSLLCHSAGDPETSAADTQDTTQQFSSVFTVIFISLYNMS